MKKKILLFSALSIFFTSNTYASKARVTSLQGAYFLNDVQFMFSNPAQIHYLPNILTYELGGATNTATPKAEGGLIKKYKEYDNAKVGIYLGHMDSDQAVLRTPGGFQREENPIDIFYGKNNWAANLSYSKTDKKTTDITQERIAFKYGINTKKYEAFAHLEAISKADTTANSYTSAPLLTIGGHYNYFKNIYTFGKITKGTVTQKVAGSKGNADVTRIELIALDRTIKTKRSQIYFGPGFKYEVLQVKSDKEKNMEVPFYIGIQYDLKKWMELRGSISQNIIIGSTKDDFAAAPGDKEDSQTNNTTVTIGTGMTFDDLVVDGVFAGSTSGNLNSNTFLANLALTFKF